MHESSLIDDSSFHTFSPRHFIHIPYFNKTCIFLYISPLFYLIVYIFLCFSLINTFFLFYFLSKYMQTFPKDTTLFTKNGHVLSHPTHLFTNTYYLHTYLIYSYTLLTLQFPFPISFTAYKRFSTSFLYQCISFISKTNTFQHSYHFFHLPSLSFESLYHYSYFFLFLFHFYLSNIINMVRTKGSSSRNPQVEEESQ